MRRIFLEFVGKKHSQYNNLINYPPEGYQFVTSSYIIPASKSYLNLFSQIKLFNLLPVKLLKSILIKNSKPLDCDFIYAAHHINFSNFPWVVDLEFSTHLCGYNKRYFKLFKNLIEKKLQSEQCKAILPWTEMGKKTLEIAFKNNKKIIDKIKLVRLAVPSKRFSKPENKEKTTLLFVGSINFPEDFYTKGGLLVFELFKRLSRYKKNIELIVRAKVPNIVKNYYRKIQNIKIIENILSFNELEKIFVYSDIFVFPSYSTPGSIFLDAMSYSLPVITTDVWANPEMIIDGYNGYLIKKSPYIQYHDEDLVPTWGAKSFNSITNIEKPILKELEEKCNYLIENEDIRKRFGLNGKKMIDEGNYSIKNRNMILKNLFNKI